MNTVNGYIGGAGTGKTTRLIENLDNLVKQIQWEKYNSVLALTFMHGSRRRLQDKLAFLKRSKIPYKCLTIDSFATQIVQRFREYVGFSKAISVIANEKEGATEDAKLIFLTWNGVRNYFVTLMTFSVVREYIRVSYPVLIIDELQDCDRDLLEVVQCLTECKVAILLAGDGFQQLSANEDCPAIDWLTTKYQVRELKMVHRTSESTILGSAHGLRENTFIQNSIKTKVVATGQLAAWIISSLIQWNGWGGRGKTLVVLYSASGNSSNFVRTTLERLKQPFIKPNYKLDAHPMFIENDGMSSEESVLHKLFGASSQTPVSKPWLLKNMVQQDFITARCLQRALYLLRIRGLEEMSMDEFKLIVGKQCHLYRSYFRSASEETHLAISIHAAKNREFDDVIILWPYESPIKDVYRRKLLYNAITRAKRNVILLVQGKDRAGFQKDKVLSLFGNIEAESNPKSGKRFNSKGSKSK